jgi:predicted dehydrogenase
MPLRTRFHFLRNDGAARILSGPVKMEQSVIRVAVVGYGYWGPNLARNFAGLKSASLVAICDERPDRRQLAQSHHPSVKVVAEFDDVLEDGEVDAVVLATPVSTHAPLAIRALKAGKHVLVEKPLASSAADARAVILEAERQNRTLMVDHTFVYMGAIRRVREIIEAGDLGELYYLDSVRVNLGLYQADVSVVWDLAIHDLSIIQYWIEQVPQAVSCVGVGHMPGLSEDVAYLTLYFEHNLIAHVHVNWLSPVKIRRMIVAGSAKTIVFDDMAADEKIKLYSRGVTRQEDAIGSSLIPLTYRRTGDIWVPQFEQTEALELMAQHFVHCCSTGEIPRTGGRQALQIVQILEAAEVSLRNRGQVVDLGDLSK